MSKDNILAQLLGGNRNSESQYYDILNRRGISDDLGDAFAQQSNQPAINAKQRNTNALMGGIGAGFKASQTALREPKLRELEGNLSQIVKTNMDLQKKLGKQQLQKASFADFSNTYYSDLKKWNDAVGANDEKAINEIGTLLFNRFREENPDVAKNMGNVDHIYNGKVFLDKNGKTEGIYIKDIIAPLIATLPEEMARELPNLNTLTMRDKFAKSDLFEDMAMQEKRASIQQHNAAANQANAHADYYRGETEKIRNQRMNPPKYDEKTAQHISKSNIDWVNTLMDESNKTERSAKAYDMIATLLDAEKGKLGRGGNSLISAVQRFTNWSGTDSARNQALLEMNQAPLLEEFKHIFGAKATDADLKQFLKTLPTLDKNSIASIDMAKERAIEIRANNKEKLLRARILEDEFGYSEPYNSQAVTKRVGEEMKKFNYEDAK